MNCFTFSQDPCMQGKSQQQPAAAVAFFSLSWVQTRISCWPKSVLGPCWPEQPAAMLCFTPGVIFLQFLRSAMTKSSHKGFKQVKDIIPWHVTQRNSGKSLLILKKDPSSVLTPIPPRLWPSAFELPYQACHVPWQTLKNPPPGHLGGVSRGNAGWTTSKNGHLAHARTTHDDILLEWLEEDLC